MQVSGLQMVASEGPFPGCFEPKWKVKVKGPETGIGGARAKGPTSGAEPGQDQAKTRPGPGQDLAETKPKQCSTTQQITSQQDY